MDLETLQIEIYTLPFTIVGDGEKILSLEQKSSIDSLKPSKVLLAAKIELELYLKGKLKKFSVPLKIGGTPFQKKVYEAMMKIPYCQVATYGELAMKVGSQKGARAVGAACNSNPLPIFVPCHRVVGVGGKLTGFAYGLSFKKTLLEMEKSND
ncbi:hypothetical protein AZF37_03945 [endosymbiont 'TC1' of Trimyema compressum]|uniref:methylated-DNA--[protein]-cysteine S-methyltransferase n=1 Tax=endosymbiont 'TC1' of Trimyema compressum TaxID=243899 RepID=UPI0007F07B56|nr:methylated-DNA--[protein]-cysteine S-methyltransferase [endosymbiont 'TC1' of Trimyema compressum]AMP20435.1 hypothetical protein AZF37_03945 [endosymbiont 'TC1' of Trimyema compressum]